jgi:hypothetical protein
VFLFRQVRSSIFPPGLFFRTCVLELGLLKTQTTLFRLTPHYSATGPP